MREKIIIGIGGLIFGFGLGLSTMTQQEVILSFLDLQDYGLLLVMISAIAVSFFAFTIIPKLRSTSLQKNTFSNFFKPVSKRIFIGAILFGVGWGISGLCPGSALASLGTGNFPVLYGILGLSGGAFVNDFFLVKIWGK